MGARWREMWCKYVFVCMLAWRVSCVDRVISMEGSREQRLPHFKHRGSVTSIRRCALLVTNFVSDFFLCVSLLLFFLLFKLFKQILGFYLHKNPTSVNWNKFTMLFYH